MMKRQRDEEADNTRWFPLDAAAAGAHGGRGAVCARDCVGDVQGVAAPSPPLQTLSTNTASLPYVTILKRAGWGYWNLLWCVCACVHVYVRERGRWRGEQRGQDVALRAHDEAGLKWAPKFITSDES